MSEPSLQLVVIAGIRSQFIKLAALLDSVRKHNQSWSTQINTICIDTGQHFDDLLSTRLFRELDISFDFNIIHKNREPDAILANTFVELSKYLGKLTPRPAWIVVFGDGNPSMAGALAATRQGYKLVHIEAGERRDRREHEEINRGIIDTLSDIYFCVSQRAVSVLKKSGISNNVYWTGDLAYDFTVQYAEDLPPGILGKKQEGYILATIHRPENLEVNVLYNIVMALNEVERNVFFLCHPRTKRRLQELGLYANRHIQYLEALSYTETLSAIKGCAFLLTDSGGIIREASHLGKRCVVRRNGGAWPELIDMDFNVRVGTGVEDIKSGLDRINLLSKQNVETPELLYRPEGASSALNILCDLTKTS